MGPYTPLQRRMRCMAVPNPDELSDASAAAVGGVRARRLMRQQRRQQRQAATGDDEEEEGPSGAEGAPAAASEEEAEAAPSRAASAAPSVRSSRAERRRRRAAPRLPKALTLEPSGGGDEDGEDVEEQQEEGTAAAAAATEGLAASQQQAGRQQRQRAGAAAAAAAGDTGDGLDADEALLPEDLMLLGDEGIDADAADEGNEDEEEEGEEEAERGRGAAAGAAAAAGSSGKGGKQGAAFGAAAGVGAGERPGPLVLSEKSPMYVPVLTDEDLAADPPGHKSGYVAVIGKPNAGKSTLINALVGQKLSIVTYKPQTTRHRVVGIASDKEYQMILFDTPGIMREQRSRLDERMMAAVVSSIKAAEAIVAVVDAADDPRDALSMFQPGPDWNGPPMAVMLNKADLVGPETLAELEEWYKTNCRAEQVFVGSALGREAGTAGSGGTSPSQDDAAAAAAASDPSVLGLKAWAVSKLPEGPTLYPKDMVSEQPERFFVSEIIREKIFLLYDQEIPYATQVQIAEFRERPGAKDYVSATVMVERPGQRGILLGTGGAALKRLGSEARKDIEAFLGRPVYLEISVQVAPDWRQAAEQLRQFGYYDPLYVA